MEMIYVINQLRFPRDENDPCHNVSPQIASKHINLCCLCPLIFMQRLCYTGLHFDNNTLFALCRPSRTDSQNINSDIPGR
jgi:hypothetical protein